MCPPQSIFDLFDGVDAWDAEAWLTAEVDAEVDASGKWAGKSALDECRLGVGAK